jgi:hypothetical protein
MGIFDEFVDQAQKVSAKVDKHLNTEYEVRYTKKSLNELPAKMIGAAEGGVKFYQGAQDIHMNREMRNHMAKKADRADLIKVAGAGASLLRRLLIGL